jgi:hypothetical protein
MEQYAEACKKINLDEAVMPVKNGMVVENVEAYNKVQKLLEVDELEDAHPYLYNLDVDEMTPEDDEKVDKLYDLAINRGFIQQEAPASQSQVVPVDPMNTSTTASLKTPQAEIPAKNDSPAPNEGAEAVGKVKPGTPVMQKISKCKAKIPSFTVMYSAMKDGEIKTGESYSNALNPRSAKADVLNKLMNCGYQNISILAIEAGDPDSSGMSDAEEAPAENPVEPELGDSDNGIVPVEEPNVANDDLHESKKMGKRIKHI